MSIDDIDYLKSNSFKQSYTFIIDSEDRDHIIYPSPNNYTVSFTVPFKNVFGLEVIDASVPRTMFSVDKYNNTLFYSIYDGDVDNVEIAPIFKKVVISEGDYTVARLVLELNTHLKDDDIYVESVSNPPDLKNQIRFVSNSNSFILDMNNSTIRSTLGFNLTQNTLGLGLFRQVQTISLDKTKYRYFHSTLNDNGKHVVQAPGIVDLIGEKYVTLHCPEIEEHSTLSLSYSKYNLGLARFKLGIVGYNDENISINRTPLREFHPIGKFPKMSLIFRTQKGELYDFKGVNHNITFCVHYYEARSNREFGTSILNPNYNANMLEYMYSVDEQDDEEDSDDEELSTDNIDSYKENEQKLLQIRSF